jgi:hypothetical protein
MDRVARLACGPVVFFQRIFLVKKSRIRRFNRTFKAQNQADMKFLLLPLFSMWAMLATAQDPISVHYSCSYDGEEADRDFYQFDPSDEADRIVLEICNAVSLSKNFVIKSSNVKNALAATEGGQRFILYSTAFLEKFKSDARTRWAAYSVLAHEIGHHLNGHDFAERDPAKRKRMELEADKFSGGVLRLLNASLNDAQAGIETFGLEGESRTHPSGSARREAIASGWKKQDERLRAQQVDAPPTATNPGGNSGPLGLPPSPDKANPADRTVSKMLEESQRNTLTTTITIAYLGDLYGCGLQLNLNIGGVAFTPTSNSFTVYNIPAGVQSYSINGSIGCLLAGSCTAGGSGQINVVPGGTYYINWSNTAYAQCTVLLIPNQ